MPTPIDREFGAAITEQPPDERVAWKSTDGPTHAGVVTFHRLGAEETRVTVQLDWQPEGLAEKVGSAVGADDRRVKATSLRIRLTARLRGLGEALSRASGALVARCDRREHGRRPGPEVFRGDLRAAGGVAGHVSRSPARHDRIRDP